MTSRPITKFLTSQAGSRRTGNPTDNKRKSSSTSSASDSCSSPVLVSQSKTRQSSKKQRKETENSLTDMALQGTSDEIKSQLVNMVTKNDIQSLKEEMNRIVTCLTNTVDKLGSAVFDLQTEKDKLNAEVRKLKGENTELKGQLEQRNKDLTKLKQDQNDNEQHGRKWNIRVYGVKEANGEESVNDCVGKCVDIFTKKVGVEVTDTDIEIAHRSGRPGGSRPRPILARFYSRRLRGEVLASRRKLKQSGISISEDLTQANYSLLKKASGHSATLAAWSTNGKILVKLKNGKLFRLDINTNIEEMFSRAM